jgi:hypothetical protein
MLRSSLQQTYVPTKKDPIPALPTSYLSFPHVLIPTCPACALILEPTSLPELPVEDLDGRWLQIPTAECWELLLSTTYTTPSSKTPDHPQRDTPQ